MKPPHKWNDQEQWRTQDNVQDKLRRIRDSDLERDWQKGLTVEDFEKKECNQKYLENNSWGLLE